MKTLFSKFGKIEVKAVKVAGLAALHEVSAALHGVSAASLGELLKYHFLPKKKYCTC